MRAGTPGSGSHAPSYSERPLLSPGSALFLCDSLSACVSGAGAIDERSIKRRNVPSAHDCGSGFATGCPWVSPTRPWKDPLVRAGSAPETWMVLCPPLSDGERGGGGGG